jgi:tetratricopeptide (TPR) repeat protein
MGGPDSADDDPSVGPVTDSWISGSGQTEHSSVGASIAHAHISQELFGKGGRTFGRFVLRRPLGSGGMGVVYEARDPELDRDVALKLVVVPDNAGASALSEAKALAVLAHPNVVPIYDVGIDGKYVYIVMELVRGDTLKDWVRDRRPREIVKAYLQAGEAIAAAHEKHLVHRDFKPSNAIMGADGRVRVVDFGLAFQVSDAGQQPRVAGTPRYMAPEQAAGASVTAAADQFSFCVALSEAFGAKVPRWLERIITRGTAPDPRERFPSMRALLTELANDPVTVWRRRALMAGLVAVGSVAFVAGRATLAAKDPACAGIGDRLAAVWEGSDRGTALARIGTLDSYGKTLQPFLQTHLDDHARRWVAGYEDACVAHRRQIQSDVVFDRRVSCLERSRAGLKSFAQILTSSGAEGLPGVPIALQAIPDPDACGDPNNLDSDVEPPATAIAKEVTRQRDALEDVRVRLAAGLLDEASTLAATAVSAARKLGYRPILAQALLVEGHAALLMDRREVAIPLFTEASSIAFETGPRSLAVEAWARRAWVEGTTSGQPSALAGEEIVEAVAEHPSTGAFARALLHNNLGGVELALERRDRARAALQRAFHEAERVKGPGAIELVWVRVNLAMTVDDPARRDALLQDAAKAIAALIGDDHPETLRIRELRANVAVRFREAVDLFEPLCARFEVRTPARAATCWADVGYIRWEMGDLAGAAMALRRAVGVARVETRPPEIAAYLALWQGSPFEAAALFEKALADRPQARAANEPFWNRVERARLELGLGRAQRAGGRLLAAQRTLSSCTTTLTAVAEKHPTGSVDRLLGRARAELAETLAATGANRKQVSDLATAATIWLARAGGAPSELRRLERLVVREISAQR